MSRTARGGLVPIAARCADPLGDLVDTLGVQAMDDDRHLLLGDLLDDLLPRSLRRTR